MQKATASKRPVRARSDVVATPPAIDVRKILEKLKLPGIDVNGLVEARRKDVEALLAANQKAYQALDSLNRRQSEVLTAAMIGWNEGARELLTAGSAQTAASRSAERAKQAFSQAMADMRELADLAAKSTEEVTSILNKRMNDGLDEFRRSLKKPS